MAAENSIPFSASRKASSQSVRLFVRDGGRNAPYRALSEDQLLEHAREVALRRFRPGLAINDPITAKCLLVDRFRGLEHEVFGMLCLDNRRRLITYVELFRGTIDGASVHPREVVKAALKHNAAAVMFTHNHPSGVAEPSHADELITRRLREALALIDITYVDHIIVAGDDSYSVEQRRAIGEIAERSKPRRVHRK